MEPPVYGFPFDIGSGGTSSQKVPQLKGNKNIMTTEDCPYYNREYSTCAISGTHQEGYHKETYCLSSKENWKKCANYEMSDYVQKLTKKLRENPDL